jgi:hypothetical protein
MPSLIDRVRALLRPNREKVTTTSTEMVAPQRPREGAQQFSADRQRMDMVKRCREMYETDPRAAGVIRALARDMTRGGFTVSAPDNPGAEELVAAMVKRLDLGSRLDDWVRLSLRDGDSFLEVGVGDGVIGALEIQQVTRKPTLQMHRDSNRFDTFDDPERAYWLADNLVVWANPPNDAVWFADWQIIHARWAHDEGKRYGRPLFASSTAPWKRIIEGERDIAIRRKTRSGMKYNHQFPQGTGSSVIQQYMELNKAALDDPYAAVHDFFGTTEIKTVQGDARLAEIGDVEHHIRTWWLSSPVPMSLLGYGQDLNRDILQEQKEQYDEAIPVLQQWVTDQIVRPMVELEWLLHGIYPPGLEYQIQWAKKKALTPEDLQQLTDAALKMRALQWPAELIVTVLQQFMPNVDLSALMAIAQASSEPENRGASGADIGRAV